MKRNRKKKPAENIFKTSKRTRLTFQKEYLGEMLKMAYSRPVYSGPVQLMKPMIGKSIDQLMTIDALLVNGIDCHRPINDQSIITQKWSQLIDCHRLPLKKCWYPTRSSTVRIRTRSTHRCLRFEFVHRIVCMQLDGFKNQQQKHTLKLIDWHR